MSHECGTPSSTRTRNSYVYPIRSLFTGVHAPVLSSPKLSTPQGVSYLDKRLSSPADTTETVVDSEHTNQQAGSTSSKCINFRHFPGESSDQQSIVSLPLDPYSSVNPVSDVVTRPISNPVSCVPIDVAGDPDELRVSSSPGHLEPISVGGAADNDATPDAGSTLSSLASAGLVHLAPIRLDTQSTNPSLTHTPPYPSHDNWSRSQSSLVDGRRISSLASTQVPFDSSAHPPSSPADPLVTYRFQHVQVGNHGHHVVLGREGKLTKCEDEVCPYGF